MPTKLLSKMISISSLFERSGVVWLRNNSVCVLSIAAEKDDSRQLYPHTFLIEELFQSTFVGVCVLWKGGWGC